MPAKIILPRARVASKQPEGAAQAVVDFTNALFGQLWKDEELPPSLLALYYADFYVASVRSGGHDAFAQRSRRFLQDTRAALAGTALVGAGDYHALLAEYLASGGVRAPKEAVARLNARFRSLGDQGGHPWYRALQSWLLSSPDVLLVADHDYHEAVARLEGAVPDVAARRAEAQRAEDDALPPIVKRLRDACAQKGLHFDRLTAAEPAPAGGAVDHTFLASGRPRVAREEADGTLVVTWEPASLLRFFHRTRLL